MVSPMRLALCLFAALMLQQTLQGIVSERSIRSHDDLSTVEQRLRSSAVHGAYFAALSSSVIRNSCQADSQPEALATPDPLLGFSSSQSRITVSFIIGTDGRIQSPLILSSDNPAEDSDILQTVRSWRYRPALCNGAPTEAEARVEFSNR
jgi:TonB family protein